MATLSKEELKELKNSPPATPKNDRRMTNNAVKENNSVSNNLRNRFKADEFKPEYEKLEAFINIPICILDVTLQTPKDKDGNPFKVMSIDCVDGDNEAHTLSTSAGQPMNMLKAMIDEHYTSSPVFPCWMIAKKEGRKTVIDFTEKDYPIPGLVDEVFGIDNDGNEDEVPF